MRTVAALMTVVALSCALVAPAFAQDYKSPAAATNKMPGKHGGTIYYAYSHETDPLYARDFKHWNYVNPNAPKGGTYRGWAFGTFDNLNVFNGKGTAAGVGAEPLMTTNADELSVQYGLLAEYVEVPDNAAWVIYKLRDEARWWDGTPVLPEDVIFSLEKLKAEGAPTYRSYFKNLAKAEKVSEREVRITFDTGGEINKELPYISGQLPILSRTAWANRDFAATTLEPFMSSGPYRIKTVKAPNFIEMERVPNYWGANLPMNVGLNNFDITRTDYYGDFQVALEAFKAGDYDFRSESSALRWATGYESPALTQGLYFKALIPDNLPKALQGFFINSRKPKFQDRRVREALQYVMDFEWMNKTLFYDQYTRLRSYWEKQEYAATGLPVGKELEILTPYRAQLPPEVFTTEYNPPKTDGSGNNRALLMRAQLLLQEAGYTVRNNRLTNAAGEPLTIEFLLVQPDFERLVAPMVQNLERLGVQATIRTVDTSQYQQRFRTFDFDIIVHSQRQSTYPGNEQRDMWTCEAANTEAADNAAGVCHPVVDALVEKIIAAPDKETLIATTKALDRVLQWQFYVIPQWTVENYRLAYWDKFGMPATKSKYGVTTGWWIDAEKERRVNAAKAQLRR
jgi:microcin C transport system substrate-binding protein